MLLKTGDVVFFKKVTRSAQRRSPEIGFKGGSGFGVMLGIVPPQMQDPAEAQLMVLMGQAGYMAFDDVKAFLGEEALKTVMAKFQDKYYPKKEEKPASKLIIAPEALSKDIVTN